MSTPSSDADAFRIRSPTAATILVGTFWSPASAHVATYGIEYDAVSRPRAWATTTAVERGEDGSKSAKRRKTRKNSSTLSRNHPGLLSRSSPPRNRDWLGVGKSTALKPYSSINRRAHPPRCPRSTRRTHLRGRGFSAQSTRPAKIARPQFLRPKAQALRAFARA